MHPPATQRLIAWIALVAIIVGQTFLGARVALCRDAEGHRLEFACDRSTEGGCQSSCPGDAPSDDAQPCRDTPLNAEHKASTPGLPPRIGDLTDPFALPPVPVELVVESGRVRRCTAPTLRGTERPPDSIVRLRTIVMLV